METITSSREIDTLFRRGRRSRRSTLVVLRLESPEGASSEGRVIYVAGRKLGNAVYRNRCKRVLRAAVHRSGARWPGSDVALVSTGRTKDADPARLEKDLVEAVQETAERT